MRNRQFIIPIFNRCYEVGIFLIIIRLSFNSFKTRCRPCMPLVLHVFNRVSWRLFVESSQFSLVYAHFFFLWVTFFLIAPVATDLAWNCALNEHFGEWNCILYAVFTSMTISTILHPSFESEMESEFSTLIITAITRAVFRRFRNHGQLCNCNLDTVSFAIVT